MSMYGRSREASERFAERRKREDEAPRLITIVPQLKSLRLDLDERHKDGVVSTEPAHIRRVVVEHAPALFFMPCGDSRCREGGHDITRPVLDALRAGDTRFEGEDECHGSQGSGYCGRVLHFVGTAEFG